MAKIICFGEVLWDVFPTHKTIGGAPLNVALRLKSFGNDVLMISSIGNDPDGRELLNFIEANRIISDEIQIDPKLETSHVNVVLDKQGSASYDIAFPCAWDNIQLKTSSKKIVMESDAFIFGSLVTRNEVSRTTLFELVKMASFKIFDVNLRTPYYTMPILNKLMDAADFIKFNDDELIEICSQYNFYSNTIESNIKFIANKTNTSNICVTLGGDGAILFMDNAFYKSSGYPVEVKDTVGAGDSFLASLINEILNNKNPQDALEFACAVGAMVAASHGANPKLSKKDIYSFINDINLGEKE